MTDGLNRIEAAIRGEESFKGKGYFFDSGLYSRYDWENDETDPGYPRKITDGWHGLPSGFEGDFDAAINGDGPFSGKCYIFKGDLYIRYDWENDETDPGYPMKITDGWHGL
ncbi:MAG: hypothetical protein HXS44_06570 [Theionarchaea archaeon]|nr:hypothetical protein [Theionarchaea archaeon]